jgi:peptidoglycan/LPS O-acetylase OafA/YrhL
VALATDRRRRSPVKLAARSASRQNNFNALRLIAASIVVVSHCYSLTLREEPFAPVSGQTLGELGVRCSLRSADF